MTQTEAKKLIEIATSAREKSYCPYSGFAVGAALLTDNDEVYTGANIESSSYTPTVCAERVAFFSAVHSGVKSFSAIAVVGGKAGTDIDSFTPPCGVCRQVMAEFCDGDFEIVLYNGTQIKVYKLSELLPESFNKANLK